MQLRLLAWPLLVAGVIHLPLERQDVKDAIERVDIWSEVPPVALNIKKRPLETTLWNDFLERMGTLEHRSPAEVGLWDYQDILYTTEVGVGPLSKPLRVLVDTGSSNLWLKEDVVSMPDEMNFVAHVTYGLGDVFGRAAKDRICLAALCVQEQDFLLAFRIRGMGRNLKLFDGILGLAFPRMLDVGSQTFFQALGAAGGFRNLGFGLALRGLGQNSFFSLGEASDLLRDARERASTRGVTLQVHGMESPAQEAAGDPGALLFWMVPMELHVADASHASRLLLNLTGYGVVDSGTSLLLMPKPAYRQTMWALTFGTGIDRYDDLVPCESSKLNHLIFHFRGKDGELSLSLSTADLLLPAGESYGEKLCKIGIASLADDGNQLPHMVLGDVFFRKVYAIFDLKSTSVTLVPETGTTFVELHSAEAPEVIPTAFAVLAILLPLFLVAYLAFACKGKALGTGYLLLSGWSNAANAQWAASENGSHSLTGLGTLGQPATAWVRRLKQLRPRLRSRSPRSSPNFFHQKNHRPPA